MAALIASRTSESPDLVEGRRGEFSVWVDEQCVAKKSPEGFPSDDDVLKAVSDALGSR